MRNPDDVSREVALLVVAHELARVLRTLAECPFCGPGCEACLVLRRFERTVDRYGRIPE